MTDIDASEKDPDLQADHGHERARTCDKCELLQAALPFFELHAGLALAGAYLKQFVTQLSAEATEREILAAAGLSKSVFELRQFAAVSGQARAGPGASTESEVGDCLIHILGFYRASARLDESLTELLGLLSEGERLRVFNAVTCEPALVFVASRIGAPEVLPVLFSDGASAAVTYFMARNAVPFRYLARLLPAVSVDQLDRVFEARPVEFLSALTKWLAQGHGGAKGLREVSRKWFGDEKPALVHSRWTTLAMLNVIAARGCAGRDIDGLLRYLRQCDTAVAREELVSEEAEGGQDLDLGEADAGTEHGPFAEERSDCHPVAIKNWLVGDPVLGKQAQRVATERVAAGKRHFTYLLALTGQVDAKAAASLVEATRGTRDLAPFLNALSACNPAVGLPLLVELERPIALRMLSGSLPVIARCPALSSAIEKALPEAGSEAKGVVEHLAKLMEKADDRKAIALCACSLSFEAGTRGKQLAPLLAKLGEVDSEVLDAVLAADATGAERALLAAKADPNQLQAAVAKAFWASPGRDATHLETFAAFGLPPSNPALLAALVFAMTQRSPGVRVALGVLKSRLGLKLENPLAELAAALSPKVLAELVETLLGNVASDAFEARVSACAVWRCFVNAKPKAFGVEGLDQLVALNAENRRNSAFFGVGEGLAQAKPGKAFERLWALPHPSAFAMTLLQHLLNCEQLAEPASRFVKEKFKALKGTKQDAKAQHALRATAFLLFARQGRMKLEELVGPCFVALCCLKAQEAAGSTEALAGVSRRLTPALERLGLESDNVSFFEFGSALALTSVSRALLEELDEGFCAEDSFLAVCGALRSAGSAAALLPSALKLAPKVPPAAVVFGFTQARLDLAALPGESLAGLLHALVPALSGATDEATLGLALAVARACPILNLEAVGHEALRAGPRDVRLLCELMAKAPGVEPVPAALLASAAVCGSEEALRALGSAVGQHPPDPGPLFPALFALLGWKAYAPIARGAVDAVREDPARLVLATAVVRPALALADAEAGAVALAWADAVKNAAATNPEAALEALSELALRRALRAK
jgi:hypothetical protein